MKATIIRPGFLVALRTSVRGGVHYERQDLGANSRGNTLIEDWQTRKTVDDTADFAAATKARSDAGAAIRKICTQTSFGLLCPATREKELDEAIATARDIAALHNARATTTTVNVYVLKGRIAQDDAEANRAIADEVRTLMDSMQEGIANLDAKAIRDAAAKARELGATLDTESQGKVMAAVQQARDAAKAIVKRIDKAGETAEAVLKDLATAQIESARFAFLDLDETKPAADSTPQIDVQRFDLDLVPETKEGAAA